MAKRTFKPLPQTVRTAEGHLFRCLYRVEWTARRPDGPESGRAWDKLFMPYSWNERLAENLTKTKAEEVVAWHRRRPHGKMFEYKIEPMKEMES
jgi:hypothetical protein